jgi:A/G-specific adenine glycosylase
MPASFEELRNLPGIGDYTAAAIASIAYRKPVAAVDGNVARVIARLFAIRENILSPGGRGRVQQIAGRLLSRDRPGDFNQAWMDLGSEICTPRRPRCDVCPLESFCQSKTAGVTDQFPVRGNGRAAKPHCAIVSVVFVHDGRLLVTRRPRGGLWSELWEFPGADRAAFPSTAAAVRRIADEAGVMLDSRPRRAGIIKHELTHRSLAFHVFVADVEEARVANRSVRWVDRAGFTKLSVSTAHRRVFAVAAPYMDAIRGTSDRS